jgi:hypothetical protein
MPDAGVAGDLAEGRRLIDAAASTDPAVGLTAVVALRRLVEVLEELQVDLVRQIGTSGKGIRITVWCTAGMSIPS